jgi:hypothetical protein
MASASPVHTISGDTHCFAFPDGTALELLRPQRDAVGRLWAEVVARAGASVLLNRGRFDLLNLQNRGRFHTGCANFNGQIDWEARVLYATQHVITTLAAQPPPARRPSHCAAWSHPPTRTPSTPLVPSWRGWRAPS